MIAKIFLGAIMILVFITLYPFFIGLWTDNTSGFLYMMSGIGNGTAMSPLEASIWGLFPLAFLILGVGGIAWLIVREKDR
jgi:hypothetical protein